MPWAHRRTRHREPVRISLEHSLSATCVTRSPEVPSTSSSCQTSSTRAHDEIVDVLRHLEQGLAPRGTPVTLHYAPRISTVLSGSEIHDLIAQQLRLDHVLTETTEFGPGRTYRIDRFVRPSREVTPRRQ